VEGKKLDITNVEFKFPQISVLWPIPSSCT